MVIAVGGCDNVEWGGIDLSIVPPEPHEEEAAAPEPTSTLPDGPVLFYVHRDSGGPTIIPVAQANGAGLSRIVPGDDPADFGARFIDAFLAPGTELALFRRSQRVGNVTVDSAAVPTGPVCRPLPRATGSVELASGAGGVTEFLALATAAAPASRTAEVPEPTRSMQVVSDMMAGEMLQLRDAAVPSSTAARRQLLPFPLAGSPDPGFTATYLVDDTLGLGGDDTGAALFVMFTPEGQTGYDTAFVGFADYGTGGKAAPRVIDFLDWNGDGNVELLLEVFGTHTSWFRAVGLEAGEWRPLFQDLCDPRTAPVPADTQTTVVEPQPRRSRSPARRPPPDLESLPDIEPTIQLSNPTETPRVGRDTARDTVPPDTGGGS